MPSALHYRLSPSSNPALIVPPLHSICTKQRQRGYIDCIYPVQHGHKTILFGVAPTGA